MSISLDCKVINIEMPKSCPMARQIFDTSWNIDFKGYNPENGETADVKELEWREFDDAGAVIDSSYITPNVNLATVYVEADPDKNGVPTRYSFQDFFENFDKDTSNRFREITEEIETKVRTAYKVKGNSYIDTTGTASAPSLWDTYISAEAASKSAAASLANPVDVSVGFVYNVLDGSILLQVEAGDNYVVTGYDSNKSD